MRERSAVVVWGVNGTWLQTVDCEGRTRCCDCGRIDHDRALWFAYTRGIDFLDSFGLHRFSRGARYAGPLPGGLDWRNAASVASRSETVSNCHAKSAVA